MFTRYFNPRPREEGDYEERGYFAIGGISIHALVKRATRYSRPPIRAGRISIHALVKRATSSVLPFFVNVAISIHALVKRVTLCLSQFRLLDKISIHALVKRATIIFSYFIIVGFISIHALVKRATKRYRRNNITSQNFNPRPREEGDRSGQGVGKTSIISIHALVKRATEGIKPPPSGGSISIHALVKRATMLHLLMLIVLLYFNPRPREEGDTVNKTIRVQTSNFNPRPREEGDIMLISSL